MWKLALLAHGWFLGRPPCVGLAGQHRAYDGEHDAEADAHRRRSDVGRELVYCHWPAEDGQ
jgi:hypothetical protein